MSDALHPSGPSQPGVNQVYETQGNPVQKEPAEQELSQSNAQANQPTIDQRIPPTQSSSMSDATFSALGHGIHGAPAGEERRGIQQDINRQSDLTAEQMGAPGEDKVADAVKASHKSGAAGSMPGLESDLDRKKAEQAPQREAQKKAEGHAFDVGGVLGQRSAPADAVEKSNYPNTGS